MKILKMYLLTQSYAFVAVKISKLFSKAEYQEICNNHALSHSKDDESEILNAKKWCGLI